MDEDAGPAGLCPPSSRPSAARACGGEQRCPGAAPLHRWTIDPWGRCSAACGFGVTWRRVGCVSVNGLKAPRRLCSREEPRPDRFRWCYERPCYPKTCHELRTQTGARGDGEFRLLVRGALVWVYCHGLNGSSPLEFLTLPGGSSYARTDPLYIGGGRPPPALPPPCAEASVTRFAKVYFNVSDLSLAGDVFTFAEGGGGGSPP